MRHSVFVVRLALGLTLLGTTAHCGDDASSAPPAGPATAATASAEITACLAALDDVVRADCEAGIRVTGPGGCNDPFFDVSGHYRRRIIEDLVTGRLSCDLAAAKACADAHAASTTSSSRNDASALCQARPVLVGEIPVGQRCYFQLGECKGGYCALDAACFGTCKAYAALGEACEDGPSCGPGNTCDSATRRCVALASLPKPPKLGEKCTDDGPSCPSDDATSAYCDAKTQTCVARRASGGACAEPSECSSFQCGTGGTCEAVADGAACSSTAACASGRACASSSSGSPTCQTLPAGYCENGDRFRCPAGAYCKNSACVPRATSKAGEACVDGSCDVGLICGEGQKCVALAPPPDPKANVGEACAKRADCGMLGSLVCVTGKCQRALRAGTACDPAADACDTFTYCGPAKTCVPRLVAGAPCASDRQCEGGGPGTCAGGVCGKSCDEDI